MLERSVAGSPATPLQCSEAFYSNAGNPDVIGLIEPQAVNVLDVGCGAGDNAALLRRRDPHKRIDGITASPREALAAAPHLEHCWVVDIESELPAECSGRRYDAMIFSHVLEHTRSPDRVLERYLQLLRPGGHCVIAVPNVAFWRQRWQLARGRFEYESSGTMDVTHLRFFTHRTAEPFLLARSPELQVVQRIAPGSVPLWILRRRFLTPAQRAALDGWGTRHWPNLFGWQVIFKATKQAASAGAEAPLRAASRP